MRVKKFLVLCVSAVLAGSMLLAGCSKKEESKTDDSLQYVKDNKELILGLDASFPPMGFTDKDQNIVGFDIDAAKEVTKRMGVKLKLQPINWDSKDQELEGKTIDCIWNGLTYSEDRAKEMLCSQSYMDNHQVLLVPVKSKIKSLKDVKKQQVGVQKGSTAADAVDKTNELKNAKIVYFGNNVEILNDLGNGCDAAVMDEVVAKYYAKKDPGKFKILNDNLTTEKYVIGFRTGDKKLCAEVEKQLKEMKKDGTLAKISKKWFGDDLTTIK